MSVYMYICEIQICHSHIFRVQICNRIFEISHLRRCTCGLNPHLLLAVYNFSQISDLYMCEFAVAAISQSATGVRGMCGKSSVVLWSLHKPPQLIIYNTFDVPKGTADERRCGQRVSVMWHATTGSQMVPPFPRPPQAPQNRAALSCEASGTESDSR